MHTKAITHQTQSGNNHLLSHNVPLWRSTVCTVKVCKLCKTIIIIKSHNQAIKVEQPVEYIKLKCDWKNMQPSWSTPSWHLSFSFRIGWSAARLSIGLELGQVQTKLPLHASKGCSGQTVTAHVVGGHRGVVLHRGFGNGLGASGSAEERGWLEFRTPHKETFVFI